MKYDFNLDLASENSLALIAKKVKPNSKVLEFGPAAGRLTKYMKEVLNCTVYIVEIDEQAAEKASIYAEKTVVDDIEKYTWLELFKDIKFDYVLFADVLEHLYYPEKVLENTKLILEDRGSIIISIPNVTHSSIIADLLVNKFDYKDTGLLDDTHIRFFTHESLIEMINQSGFFILTKEAIFKNIYESELGNQFDLLPSGIKKYLKNKEFSDVYQFVLEIKTSKLESEYTKYNKLSKTNSYYFSQLYINSGNGFNELNCLKKDIYIAASNNIKLEFDLKDFNNILDLRFDPINVNSYIQLNSITYTDFEGHQFIVTNYTSNALLVKENLLYFNIDDPQITFKVDVKEIRFISFSFDLLDTEFDELKIVKNLINENLKLIEWNDNLNNQVQNLHATLSSLEEGKLELIRGFEHFESLTKELQNSELNYRIKIEELEQQAIILQDELEISQMKLNTINGSILSKIKNIFKNEEKR